MTSFTVIQFKGHHEIDKVKWDECIAQAANRLIYAKSFYLDAMAPGWTALTNENYDWVLPITAKQKLGIRYLYQPNFTQQLGVFYKKESKVPWAEIISWLKKQYGFWEINWNYAGNVEQIDTSLRVTHGTNFVLDLSPVHSNIEAHYHNDLRKNLKNAQRFPLLYQPATNYEKGIALYIEHYSSRMPQVKPSDYMAFKKLCAEADHTNSLICREVVDNNNNNVLAIIVLLSDGYRLYNVMNTTTEEGRRCAANHLLIASLIKEFANSKLLIDFEGSDLPGVKSFYKNFGAINQPYYILRYNKLPWLLRWLKR